jgi:putative ABC transport system permease protein
VIISRALNKKLFRDLMHIRGQAASIAAVIGCGIATLVLSFGAMESLEATQDAYYERYRFADVFAHLERAPKSLARRINQIPGVNQVEVRITQEVTLDVHGWQEPISGRLISLPAGRAPVLNDIALRVGRLPDPGKAFEVLLAESFAKAHQLLPGDSLAAIINGRKRELNIVGVVLTPEYVYTMGPGMVIPDDHRFAILWLSEATLAAAYNLESSFNDVSLSLSPGTRVEGVVRELDKVLAPFGSVGAYERADQMSHAFLANELDQLRAIGTLIPPFFFAVAAFLINVVLSRIIDREREQIGLLKALGYSNWVISANYLKLVFVLCLLGTVFGFALGAWTGREVTEMYTQFFHFPFLYYRIDFSVFAIAAGISFLAAVIGALRAIRQVIALAPAIAMRPAPPAIYRRGFFEITGLIRLFSQPGRMILRNITRWPFRAAMTTLGVAFSLTILIGMLFMYDAVDEVMAIHFDQAQRQDVTITFANTRPGRTIHDVRQLPGVLRVEPQRSVPAWLAKSTRRERTVIEGLSPTADLRRALDQDQHASVLPDDGLVLSSKMAELLKAKRGDLIHVELLEGERRIIQVPVSHIIEEYIAKPVYMDIDALNRLMREQDGISGVYLKVDPVKLPALYEDLKGLPAVAGVSIRKAALDMFRDTMAETMNIMLGFYVFFSSIIAVGVVYNSARISLSERGRDLASLRVLGFSEAEVSFILLGELAVLTLLALPVGCLLGTGMAWLMVHNFDTELFRIPLVIEPSTYGKSLLVVLAAAIGSAAIVRQRIKNLDLIAVLKTRE